MPQNQDPMASGPFSNFLQFNQQPQPTYNSTAPPLTGYEHAGGIIAKVGDSFLRGLSEGRAKQAQKSEVDRSNTLSAINSSISQVQSSSLPEEAKQQQLGKLFDMRGHIFLSALDDGGDGKKGKKGAGGEAKDFARHVITSMIGPGKEKQAFTPEEIHSQLFQTNQLLSQAPKLAAENTEKADAPIRALVAKHTKDGVFDPIGYKTDPEYGKARSQNIQLVGGDGSGYAQQMDKLGAEQYQATYRQQQAEELKRRADKDAQQAAEARSKTPEGRAEFAEKGLGLKPGTKEYKDYVEYSTRPPAEKMTATAVGIKWANGVMDKVRSGDIEPSSPDVQTAKDLLRQIDDKHETAVTANQTKRDMVDIRRKALGLSGAKAVNGIDATFDRLEQNINKQIGSGLTKEAAQPILDKLNEQRKSAYERLGSANNSAKPAGDGGNKKTPQAGAPASSAAASAIPDSVFKGLTKDQADIMKQFFGPSPASPTAAPPAAPGGKSKEDLNKTIFN